MITTDQIAERLRLIAMRTATEDHHLPDDDLFSILRGPIDEINTRIGQRIEAAFRAWALSEGHRGAPEASDLEAAVALYHATAARLSDGEEEGEEEDDPDPVVQVWIGGGAWKGGPWGKVRSSIVAIYAADWIETRIERHSPGADISVEIRPRKRTPAWVLASSEAIRREWMDRIAGWIDEFSRSGWREFYELREGSGAVPGTGIDP